MSKNKMSKREKDIKGKLMAAIAMLLVSSIMMVSTTYAWFTLSTAPEVKGIQTAVGANGNLEMALLAPSGAMPAESTVGDAMKEIADKNITWGNLVDVSDKNVYGLDKIVLNPSALAYVDATTKTQINTGYFVEFPEYGADGRVSELSKDAVYAIYANNQFVPKDGVFGVRAVGASSGMTPRQLAYRNARNAGATAMSQAKNEAQASLSANGDALANLAIKKATSQDTYGASDVAAVQSIVTSLTTDVLPKIEVAYMQYILAYAASRAAGTGTEAELAWQAVSSLISADGARLLKSSDSNKGLLEGSNGTYTLTVSIGEGQNASVTLPDNIGTAIAKYEATLTKVAEAHEMIYTGVDGKPSLVQRAAEAEANPTEKKLTWNDFSGILTRLANPETMTVNDLTPEDIKKDMNPLVQAVAGGKGLTVAMANGGGVYADIAEHCGDYTTSVEIQKIQYGTLEFGPLTARMQTQCIVGNGKGTVQTAYLSALGSVMTSALAPSSEGSDAMPLSETYAFIIDLAFRTNASGSNLQLQAKATDRIYSDNNNEDTMGGGATMTFKATSTDFTDENVKDLMENIKIVFFNPLGEPDVKGTVYALAKLDVANATISAEGVTAELYIYEIKDILEITYEEATYAADSDVEFYTKGTEYVYTKAEKPAEAAAGTLYTKDAEGDGYTQTDYNADSPAEAYFTRSTKDVYTEYTAETAPAEGVQLYKVKETKVVGTEEVRVENNKIMALPQNEAVALSVLVYLDGNTITNADVSIGASSMTGTMNLQFSSSATLVPMEYGDLHTANPTQTSGSTTESTGG